MNKSPINLSFLLTCAVLLIFISITFLGLVSAATPIYQTNACWGYGQVSWTGGDVSDVGGMCVTAGQIVNTPTTSGSCWAAVTGPNGHESCGTCGARVSCTSTNTFIGWSDNQAPTVVAISPVAGTVYNTPQTITISADVTDDVAVSSVVANIQLPSGAVQQIALPNVGGSVYSVQYSIPAVYGGYVVTFVATDTSNNVNNAVTTSFSLLDNQAPTVVAISPVAGTVYNTPQTITISADVTDDVAVSSVQAYVILPDGSNSGYGTLNNVGGNTYSVQWTIPAMYGTYFVFFEARDTSNNLNNAEWTFFDLTDVVNPTIQFVAPTPANNSFLNVNNINVDVTAADLNLAGITINLFNSANVLVGSATTATSPNIFNFAGLADGVYFVNAIALDSAGNSASTETRTVTIDTILPVITILSPAGGSTIISFPFSINFALSEAGNCNYSLDNGVTNNTMAANASSTGFTTSIAALTNGAYTLTAYCADSAGNSRTASSSFSVSVDFGSVNSGPIMDKDRGPRIISTSNPFDGQAVGVSEEDGDAISLSGKKKLSLFGSLWDSLFGNRVVFWIFMALLALGVLIIAFLISSVLGGRGAAMATSKGKRPAGGVPPAAVVVGSDKKKSKSSK